MQMEPTVSYQEAPPKSTFLLVQFREVTYSWESTLIDPIHTYVHVHMYVLYPTHFARKIIGLMKEGPLFVGIGFICNMYKINVDLTAQRSVTCNIKSEQRDTIYSGEFFEG